MSYCRFSSDDFACDVYVYGAEDGITVHVAGNRLKLACALPKVPAQDDPNYAELFIERAKAVSAAVDGAERVDIEHPDAGQDFYGLTHTDAAALLRRLVGDGFRVPASAIEALDEEALAG